jgi:iron complex outermembrane recepter protein
MRRTLLFGSLVTWLLLMAAALGATAQTAKISGRIIGADGQPLSGATAVIQGTTNGTGASADGSFSIENVSAGNYTLVVSFIGYKSQQLAVSVPGSENLRVTLATDATSLSDVVVTGVFDERKKVSASVSITTLDSKQIERLAPVNAVDLLTNVPGIFVNSSVGEVRSTVSTRGIANRASYFDDLSGLYYVSLQEDGLPVSSIYFSNFTPDLFYRSDATLKRLEAVRGGTASITGANAPGGIFNYLSKTGGSAFGGEVRAKVGLEGNGRNPYYRTDVSLGGPLGASGWAYNVGGFYRYSNGPRYPGYAMNNGGQIKANVEKRYENGSITFYGKFLDDRNGTTSNLIGRDFSNPQLVDGLKNNASFGLPANSSLHTTLPDGTTLDFDPKNQNHAREFAAGLNWQHSFSNAFSLSNNAKFSAKELTMNVTQATSPIQLTDLIPNALAGTLGNGTITYRDNQTKQTLATVQATLGARGPGWTVLTNNLPGQNILQNGLLYQGAYVANPKIKEFMDQLVLSYKTEKMTFNVGSYVGISDVGRYTTSAAGLAFTTLEDRPRMLDITYVNQLAGGVTQQISSPEGYFKTGGGLSVNSYALNKKTFAPFFAHTWRINEQLTLDYGVRLENTTSKGTNYVRKANNGQDGGLDGNRNTTYDNGYYRDPLAIDYKFTTNTFSYSAALNYLLTPTQSVYGRYSEGRKAPEFNQYQTIDTPGKVALTDPAVQEIRQIEVGYKMVQGKVDVAVTPFYSRLSNILQTFFAQDATNTLYNLQPYFNSIETLGVELEANATVNQHLSFRGVATFQRAKFLQFKSATAGPTTSKDDDSFVDYSENYADNTPRVLLNLTPTYAAGKFYTFLTYQYTGDRYANAPNAFILKGFSLLNLGAGYTVGKHLDLTLNVNNLLNSNGVLNWGAPGGFPNTFNLSDFTTTSREAKPDALFPIGTIQPRAYFLTAAYKL